MLIRVSHQGCIPSGEVERRLGRWRKAVDLTCRVGIRVKELLEVISVTVYIAGTWERRGGGSEAVRPVHVPGIGG